MNKKGVLTTRIRPAVSRNKLIGLGCVILAGLVFYILNATKSGLFGDEAVEYFFSKNMTGTVVGGAGTTNMFERIRYTFQPPLYNILMFFWINIFDSEFGFRLAGILVTMAGAAGIFFAVEETVKDGIWSVLATAVYVFTCGIFYYGLECAEYNLMLCFMAWTMWSFLRLVNRKDLRSMAGFFIFASLTVYSQYGAAFMVAGMYIAVFALLIKEKRTKELKQFLLISAVTLAVAVLPLLILFTIPQMNHQGSMTVDHGMSFSRGFFVDFFAGFKDTLGSLFGADRVTGVLIVLASCPASLFINRKKMAYPILALLISWALYFITVSCSFYGYNYWKPESVGTMNLGGKYSLFFIPVIVVLMISGLGILVDHIKDKSRLTNLFMTAAGILLALVFCLVEIIDVYTGGFEIKDNCREIVPSWYEREAYNSKTLIYLNEYETFSYYLLKDDRYADPYFDSVEVEGDWIRDAEPGVIAENIEKEGYLDLDEFYYVTTYYSNYENFITAVTNEGYDAEILYSGVSVFIHVTRQE